MKKSMRHFICVLLLILICFSLCACGGKGSETLQSAVSMNIKILAEKAYGPNRALVSWKAEEGATYKVLRATEEDGKYEEIYNTANDANINFYIDKKRDKDKQYFYKLEKISDAEVTAQECTVSKEIIVAKLTEVSAVSDGSQVKVSWKETKGATQYAVYRCSSADGEFTYLGTSKTNSYTDKELSGSKECFYKVCAFGGAYGESRGSLSDAAKVYLKLAKPTVSNNYDKGSQYVTLSWKTVKEAEKYFIYRQNSGGSFSKISETTGTSYKEMISRNGVHQYKVAGVYTHEGKEYVGNLSNASTVIVNSIIKKPSGKMVALTFDDGPGPYTQSIVDCLAKNNAHATFFVLGQNVGRYPSAVKYAYQNGNEIASHSYSHPILSTVDKSVIESQMKKTDDAIKKVIGKVPDLMRAPGGGVNDTVKKTVGKPIIMWSIDTLDWKTRDKVQTINSVMSKVKDGDIILMHDIHKPTMEAALELIPMLKNEGYQLVTVSELAKAKGYNLQSGKVYYSLR